MTLTEILAVIADQQAANSYLNKIDNTSALSVIEQLNQVYAGSAEILFDRLKLAEEELQEIADSAPWATEQWYIEKALEFRYGQELTVNQYTQYYYDDTGLEEDEIKEMQLIKQAACELCNKNLIIKIAGEDNDGNLSPVEDEKATAFKAYIEQVKRPGTPITIYNYSPDLIQIEYDIYFNALCVENEVLELCTEAVTDYLKNIIFNGFFSVTGLTDALQDVDGVEDPYFTVASRKRYFDSDFTEFERRIRAYSGYFTIDTLTLNMKTQ